MPLLLSDSKMYLFLTLLRVFNPHGAKPTAERARNSRGLGATVQSIRLRGLPFHATEEEVSSMDRNDSKSGLASLYLFCQSARFDKIFLKYVLFLMRNIVIGAFIDFRQSSGIPAISAIVFFPLPMFKVSPRRQSSRNH